MTAILRLKLLASHFSLTDMTEAVHLCSFLKEQLALYRNAAAGGGGRKGVLWKGEPPSLDESEDYGVWKKKL